MPPCFVLAALTHPGTPVGLRAFAWERLWGEWGSEDECRGNEGKEGKVEGGSTGRGGNTDKLEGQRPGGD